MFIKSVLLELAGLWSSVDNFLIFCSHNILFNLIQKSNRLSITYSSIMKTVCGGKQKSMRKMQKFIR